MDVDLLKSSGKPVRIPQSRKETIEAELKLLEWHKMANAAAIKGALLQTKNTRDNSPQKAPQHAQDDERWIKRVIKEEHTRPLNVAKDFVLEYEEKEKVNADRLTHQVDRHISTLKTLRSKLETRHELKTRTEEYRAWQREFNPKKQSILMGKTLDEYNATLPPKTANLSDPDADIDDEAMRKGMTAHNKNASSQELSTVLDSLSRLADLEQRIAGLEKENKYDRMKEVENPGGANQRTSIEFRKKRAAAPEPQGPVGISYQIRPKAAEGGPWNVQMPVGGAANAVRANRHNRGDEDGNYDDGAGGGTFITAQQGEDGNSVAANREWQKRERARQLELASAGQKQLRGRVQDKRARAKEQMLGAKKHEAAMKEMARRKHENSRKPAKMGVGAAANNANKRSVAVPQRGIAAGVKNKNKHLQEFENMKASYRKKKEANERKTYAQEASAVGKRFVSQTAPAYDNKNHPQYRVPATKVGGTVTRRTDVPTRRGAGGAAPNGASDPLSRLPSTAPAIAVTGLGGLRVLKANNNAAQKRGAAPRR